MKKKLTSLIILSFLLVGTAKSFVGTPAKQNIYRKSSNIPTIDTEREYLTPVGLGNGQFSSDIFGVLNLFEKTSSYEKKLMGKERIQKKIIFWFTQSGPYNIYDDYIDNTTYVYKFSNYVDLPVYNIKNAQLVYPGNNFYAILDETASYSRTTETIETISNSFGVTAKDETKIGAEVGLDELTKVKKDQTISISLSYNFTETLTEKNSETYSHAYSITTYYGPIVNNNDFSTYYEINFRQKFSLYLIVSSSACYTETNEYDDWFVFSTDPSTKTRVQRKYRDISFDYYKVSTYYVLVPEEPIYEAIDCYYDDPDTGKRIYMDLNKNQYVVRFGSGSSILQI